jgi:prolyl oligopeptidase
MPRVGIHEGSASTTCCTTRPYARTVRIRSPNSLLQNAQPPTAYPAVLMTPGANDPPLAPWQARKFTVALQGTTTSAQPIILLTRMNAGHDIGSPFSQRVGDAVIGLTFFAHEPGFGIEP